jgi:long-chain acyl-CoA synthetase
MPRQSLLEYFQADSRPANDPAVAWRRGYRMQRWKYADLLRVATQFARELEARRVAKGDRVLLWGENCGEWMAAFLGCLVRGAVAVPIDAIAAPEFAASVARQAGARLAVVGRGIPSLPAHLTESVIWMEDLPQMVSHWPAQNYSSPEIGRSDPIEIVYTSGSTAEPRGVVLTHGNVLANLAPIEKEFEKYRRYERIFHPLRFLDLLPLSHVFGQMLGIFLPQIFGATSIFLDTLNPSEVIKAIHDERASVLVTVPRLVESLQGQIERDIAASGQGEQFRKDVDTANKIHFLRRWWRFRKIHRRFGWKFWAVFSGGAALPAGAEQFWDRLGYAVLQGYGLTETTSTVSVNHPFRPTKGSIGKAMPGLELKLSDTGEILVRGENVSPGYWKDGGVAPVRDADGWFHTGDVGERDADGNLFFKSRSKNVIVTPEGLKVYPEDLEAELRKEPEVRDCVVIGLERNGNAEACAVLLLRDVQANAAAIVRRANERLAAFQQMRRWMVWREKDFPRTHTQKPALVRIREAAETEFGARGAASGGKTRGEAEGQISELLARITGRDAGAASENAKLQLSSIERVELLSALEDRYQVDLSDTDFTTADSVAALEKLLDQPPTQEAGYEYPRWPQNWATRLIRAGAFYLLIRPAMLLLGWPSVRGRENLRGVKGPVVVISNHITYLDQGYIMSALPRRIRKRLAIAMGGERLQAMRKPPEGTGIFGRIYLRTQYYLVTSLFNVFPLPQHSGYRKSFAFAGDLADRGWSVLIFPEGLRTEDGKMAPFQKGIGLLATRLGLPIIPMRIDGLFELAHAGKRRAKPGQIRVTIGAPVKFGQDETPEEIAKALEERVAGLAGIADQANRK